MDNVESMLVVSNEPEVRRRVQTLLFNRATRSSTFTVVLDSIYHGYSGSVRFICFVQVTIPRVWIGEHIFVVEFDVNGEYTVVEFDVNDSTHGQNFRERKVPTENLERFSR